MKHTMMVEHSVLPTLLEALATVQGITITIGRRPVVVNELPETPTRPGDSTAPPPPRRRSPRASAAIRGQPVAEPPAATPPAATPRAAEPPAGTRRAIRQRNPVDASLLHIRKIADETPRLSRRVRAWANEVGLGERELGRARDRGLLAPQGESGGPARMLIEAQDLMRYLELVERVERGEVEQPDWYAEVRRPR
ncbi:hypothetical protein [Roseisolibacter sp. H3M3-2]|uniref:hypothetical protein n=1 Tax=Roseisolibacter sp. H3M3-2 TaxID=3031323 RepID=UPI0023DB2800|nr:hypothetical protein [Roseisolibacter sp. H3M3-2]MDF1501315.1 hypothetical protein [Roseisolibacter sp. H3M3-2]